jgi:hypothetical protein
VLLGVGRLKGRILQISQSRVVVKDEVEGREGRLLGQVVVGD